MNKKRIIIAVACVAVILIGVLVYTLVIAPGNKYNDAVKAMQEKRYTDASLAFQELKDYKDSGIRLQELHANELFDSGMYADVVDMYATLPAEYRDHADDLTAMYADASAKRDTGQFDEAIAIFSSLGNYTDSATQIKQTKYLKAAALADNKQFDEAVSLYTELGSYSDAVDMITETRYQKAGYLAEQGKYDEAVELYNDLSDYKDSKVLVQKVTADEIYDSGYTAVAYNIYATLDEQYQTHKDDYQALFDQAIELRTAGQYDDAIAAFISLGNYPGAADQVLETKYLKADALSKAGFYLEARAIYIELPDYKDSKVLAQKAKADRMYAAGNIAEAYDIYTTLDELYQTHKDDYVALFDQALELRSAGQYDDAIDVFRSLGNYPGAADQILETQYLKADALAKAGSYQETIKIYTELSDYKDSKMLAVKTTADEKYDSGDIAGAYDVYATLDESYQTHKADYEAKYTEAEAKLTEKKYDEASALFKALGNYADSAERSVKCIQDKAADLLKDEKYVEAAEVYQSLGETDNQKQAYYLRAGKLLKEKQYEAAAKQYSAILDYKDSREQRYQVGLVADQAGDELAAVKVLSMDLEYSEAKETVYQIGKKASADSKYDVSTVAFTAVGAYKDAAMNLSKDTYAWGGQLFDNGEYNRSAEVFESMGDFSDAPAKALEAKYAFAKKLLDDGAYQEALNLFNNDSLKGYKDSITYVGACHYGLGYKALQNKQFDKALKWFDQAGDYEDSREKVKECRYQIALSLMSSQKYNEAITAFEAVKEYKDSSEQIVACQDALGQQYEAEKDYEKAYEQFQLAGNADKAKENAYQAGLIKLSKTQYADAIDWFTKAEGYRDSKEQILGIGEYYYQTKQYDLAESALVKVVGTGNADQLLFELGNAYEERGDKKSADRAYHESGEYAIEHVYKPNYDKGITLREEQKWDEARAAFAKAGDYADATEQIKETSYQEAASCMTDGKYGKAYNIYMTIADYKDVDSLLKNDAQLQQIMEKVASYKKVNNIVTFGTYPQTEEGTDQIPIEWIVLDYDEVNGKSLLLSRYGLDAVPYNTENTRITWEECSLRSWLNGEFLNKAFSTAEQSAILNTKVDNSESQGYSNWNINGENNTEDRIFLLSYAEANWYLDVTYGDSNNMKSRVAPTAYAIAQGAWANDSDKTEEGAAAGWWWLRSPGDGQDLAAGVSSDGSLHYGNVYYGDSVVRPAFWFNLKSGIF